MSQTQTINLLERSNAVGATIDRDAGIIRRVKILGAESKNNRTYTQKALREAANLYDGAKVRINHPSEHNPNEERAVQDTWGEIRNPVLESEGVFGDIHYVKEHRDTPHLLELAERFPNQFGLSQNADGKVRYESGSGIVESVGIVRGVDVVDKPATTEGLFESHNTENETMKTTVRAIFESCFPGNKGKNVVALIESEMGVAAAEAPVEVPEESSNEDKVKAAFREMVIAAFDDDALDAKATLAKIKEILKSQEKLLGSGDVPEDIAGGGEGGDDTEPTNVPESNRTPKKDASFEELREAVSSMAAREQRRDMTELLESVGLEANDFRLKHLSRCESNDERKTLIESWLGGSRGKGGHTRGTRPLSTGAARLMESHGFSSEDDYDSLSKGFFKKTS